MNQQDFQNCTNEDLKLLHTNLLQVKQQEPDNAKGKVSKKYLEYQNVAAHFFFVGINKVMPPVVYYSILRGDDLTKVLDGFKFKK